MLSSWAGLILVLVASGEYLVRLFTRRAPRSTSVYDFIILVGVIMVGAAVTYHHAPVWRFAGAAGIGLVWFVVTRAELRFLHVGPNAAGPNVGDPLPAFRARTSTGEPFASDQLVARAPALLVVYRGHW